MAKDEDLAIAGTESRPLTLRDLIRVAHPAEENLLPDLFSGYEEYHAHVETGHMPRAALVASWIEPASRVLDAGCGDGSLADFLRRERGAFVDGLDLAQAAVDKTRARGIPARVQDLDADPGLPDGYDYILFVEVLEHLRAPHVVLREAVRKASRAVIVTLPNTGWLGYRAQMLLGHAPVQSFTHLHLWSHRDFLAFCRKLGLPEPELRFLASGRSLRAVLLRRWPNLLAHQLAYRIASRPSAEL